MHFPNYSNSIHYLEISLHHMETKESALLSWYPRNFEKDISIQSNGIKPRMFNNNY